MKIRLETERLFLREFTLDDAELLYEMHLDPEISRYTGDPFPWDGVEQSRHILAEVILPQYALQIGRWAVHLNDTREFLGWCGLKKVEHEYDLGYRFLQKHWMKGYATESASAVLMYGVGMNLNPIIGKASVSNTASVAVLGKCGLTFESRYVEDSGMESVRFRYVYP